MMMLSGWKTYLAAAAGVAVAGLKAQGYIDDHTASLLRDAIAFLGLAALRAAVQKVAS